MVAVLGVEDHRQQTGAGPAAHDRIKRCRLLGDLFAAPATEFFPHGLDHLVATGNNFQRLGDVLVDLGKLAATVGAGAGAGQHIALARQMGRQRASRWALAGEALDHGFGLLGLDGCCRDRRYGLVFAGRRFQLFELQLQLVEQVAAAFRALTELFAPKFGDLELEMLDHHLGTHGPRLYLSNLSTSPGQRGAQALDGLRFGGGWRCVHAKYIAQERAKVTS